MVIETHDDDFIEKFQSNSVVENVRSYLAVPYHVSYAQEAKKLDL